MATEAVSGAWLLLAEVAAQDPSAPSWEFLQVFSRFPAPSKELPLGNPTGCSLYLKGSGYREYEWCPQEAWERVKAGGAQGGRDKDGALLLRVIAHAAGRFPPAKAAALAGDLLEVCCQLRKTPPLFSKMSKGPACTVP